MIIAVLLKQVTIVRSRSGRDPRHAFVCEADRVTLNNPVDEAALIQAVQLKQAGLADAVHVLCLGDRLHRSEAIRALALGADQFVFLNDAAGRHPDAWSIAGVLSRAVVKVAANLVLCGNSSLDRSAGEVGAFTAHRLAWPYIGNVVRFTPGDAGKQMTVERALGRGARELLAADLPLVIGVGTTMDPPDYPSLTARRTAESKPILEWGAADLPPAQAIDDPRVAPGKACAPNPRCRPMPLPDGRQDAYVRIDRLLAGAQGGKSGAVIQGAPEEMARRLLTFLSEQTLLPGEKEGGCHE